MLKLISFFISIFLIFIIFFRMPQENEGLVSFATKSNILGSPSSARRILNISTGVAILMYIWIAVQLNLK